MARIDVVLSDDVEREFREEIAKELGFKKGNISIAIEEAVKMWMEAKRTKRSAAAKKAWAVRKKDK